MTSITPLLHQRSPSLSPPSPPLRHPGESPLRQRSKERRTFDPASSGRRHDRASQGRTRRDHRCAVDATRGIESCCCSGALRSARRVDWCRAGVAARAPCCSSQGRVVQGAGRSVAVAGQHMEGGRRRASTSTEHTHDAKQDCPWRGGCAARTWVRRSRDFGVSSGSATFARCTTLRAWRTIQFKNRPKYVILGVSA